MEPNIELGNVENDPAGFVQLPLDHMNPQPIIYDSTSHNLQPISGTFEKLSQPIQPVMMPNSAQSPVTISFQPIANQGQGQIVQPQMINTGNFVQTGSFDRIETTTISQPNIQGSIVESPSVMVEQSNTLPQEEYSGDDPDEVDIGIAAACCIMGCFVVVVALLLGTIFIETGIGVLLYLGIPIGMLMMALGCGLAFIQLMTGRRY